MLAKKQLRRERALKRLEAAYNGRKPKLKVTSKGEIKPDPKALAVEHKNLERMEKEIAVLKDRLAGKKKQRVVKKAGEAQQQSKDKWLIDIFQINLGYVKNSVRRKKENKGKSKKKMKKIRSRTFVKSVVAQPGMIQNYREGRMGISPKNHSFVMRKEEPTFFT